LIITVDIYLFEDVELSLFMVYVEYDLLHYNHLF